METLDWGKGHIDPFWDDEYKSLQYDLEKFNNPQDLVKWHRQGYVHPDTHYTGFLCDMKKPQPTWNQKFINWFAEEFGVKNVGTSYYRMGTGVILPVHGDIYKRYRELFGCELKDIVRVVVMLEDWQSGHYFEIDNQPQLGWSAGDYHWWIGDTPHMAANIGITKRYTLQLTGHR